MIKLTQINEIKTLFNEVFIEAIGPNAPIIEKEIEGERICAYYNSNLAGFATIWEGDEIFLHFLFIKKSERRKRIGTTLIKALLEYYKKPIKLKCLIKNKNALAQHECRCTSNPNKLTKNAGKCTDLIFSILFEQYKLSAT